MRIVFNVKGYGLGSPAEETGFRIDVCAAVNLLLDVEDGEALLKRHADDGPHPYETVAANLDIPIDEAQARVSRGLRQLRALMFDAEDGQLPIARGLGAKRNPSRLRSFVDR